jgi:hypothetical protein
MNRITESDLQAKVNRLNRITNSPAEPYTDNKANIGNFHLSHAYGGVCLHRMYNDGGGCTAPLIGGHVSKRELAGLLDAFIAGIESTKGE